MTTRNRWPLLLALALLVVVVIVGAFLLGYHERHGSAYTTYPVTVHSADGRTLTFDRLEDGRIGFFRDGELMAIDGYRVPTGCHFPAGHVPLMRLRPPQPQSMHPTR